MYHWMSESVFREGGQNLARFVTFCRMRGDTSRSNPPVFFIDINLIIFRVGGHKLCMQTLAQGGNHVAQHFPLTAIPRRMHRISSDLRS